MKRDAFGEGEGLGQGQGPSTFKRPRNDDDEVCFLIPSKVAGSIIGKGGVNISKLRNQYKAQISIPDCPGPERVLSITAADIDTTVEIVKEILPKLSDQLGPQPGGEEEDIDARLLIHQSRAGCVIGKGGAKIKELRERTGARLKIFSSPAPQSTERVVQLLGREDAIAAGLREVLQLTKETPVKGGVASYDPHNYDDFYADEYGGYGAGQGGGGGGGGAARPGGARPPPPRVPLGPPAGPGGRGGPPPRGPMMGRNGPPGGPGPRPPFNDFAGPVSGPAGPRPGFNGPPRGNFGAGAGGFGAARSAAGDGPGFGAGPDDSGDDTSTQVTIPKDLAGAIIGRAGSRIRKIRAESGAGIEIAEPLPGSSERIITITGAPPQIQMAQYLLQQSVHESHPNLTRGNY